MVALVAVALCQPAHAHEWYTGRADPISKSGCCGGSDCAPVPLDVDWVQPVRDGLHVTLTWEQAKTFNKHAYGPIDVTVPWNRIMSMTVAYNGPPAFYHVCIVGGELRCLFAVPSL